ELQAVAAKSGSLSIAGLFVKDAVAEFKDREFRASGGSGRAQRFSIADTEFANLRAGNIQVATGSGQTSITGSTAAADSMNTPDYQLQGVTGRNLRVATSDRG